jgi:pyruvate kinase
VTRDQTPGRAAIVSSSGKVMDPARIPCSLPEIFTQVKAGESIWFDDGKIGGVIATVDFDEISVNITHAEPAGSNLGSDKGINLPQSDLRMPSLTSQDIMDLEYVVNYTDLIGLSFVDDPDDVFMLHDQLKKRGRPDIPVILKIETRRAFERLPSILLAAMQGYPLGVMIARGDLAVECGYTLLAELQEEILWITEAAHVPVIWATQVLDTMAKKGTPTRAEITDAAMSSRAECVMLNKGPYILETVHLLDDVLQRMQSHQSKKTSKLQHLEISDVLFDLHA